jgi:hypothetical protein
MKVKEIKARLESENIKIQIKGIFDINNELKTFKIWHDKEYNINSLQEDVIFGRSMNVDRFGPTCMWLFSFDMMGNKISSKVKYSNVIIIEE